MEPVETASPWRCIYCLATDVDFSSDEHIFGESLGNTEVILPKGLVCTPCNNRKLSQLDNYLCDFAPISVLRAVYVDRTKKGKAPRAHVGDISVTRTQDGHIKLVSQRPLETW